jgi:hypothetical protein
MRDPNKPFVAKEFYDCVRCGLMHEGRTKRDWLVTAAKKDAKYPYQFIFLDKATNKKSINRTILQERLVDYFENQYLVELQLDDNDGEALRRLFARKLDHLYDIDRDTLYDWWLDKKI